MVQFQGAIDVALTQEKEEVTRLAVVAKHLEFFSKSGAHPLNCQHCNNNFKQLKAQSFVPLSKYQKAILSLVAEWLTESRK